MGADVGAGVEGFFQDFFSGLGDFRPCVYAGQNNPGEEGK